MSGGDGVAQALRRARELAARGEDEAAKQAYIDVLRLDPTHVSALNELGTLAYASGHRSAARLSYERAVEFHPTHAMVRVNLGNLLLEEGDSGGAEAQYRAALATDADFPEAHQGLARILDERGDAAAALHWQKGFSGHAVVAKPHRGTGTGVELLLLVTARGGNLPTRQWIDERRFAVTAVYAEFHDPAQPLPRHALVVNAIGDADLCGLALERAEAMLAGTTAPVLNPPALVRATGRADNARRLGALPGVIAPRTMTLPRAAILASGTFGFPLLLRAPGFHTGQHFLRVESREALPGALATLPGETLLAIEHLDARGPDGMARKYRVMFIDGVAYPLHLAIAADWKVHYFTAAMATNAAFRDEERRFLEDMPVVLGARAMAALAAIGATLDLNYAGIDFALAPDGSVLLFEANATMAIIPPDQDPIWNYRRRAIDDVLGAARWMLARRSGQPDWLRTDTPET